MSLSRPNAHHKLKLEPLTMLNEHKWLQLQSSVLHETVQSVYRISYDTCMSGQTSSSCEILTNGMDGANAWTLTLNNDPVNHTHNQPIYGAIKTTHQSPPDFQTQKLSTWGEGTRSPKRKLGAKASMQLISHVQSWEGTCKGRMQQNRCESSNRRQLSCCLMLQSQRRISKVLWIHKSKNRNLCEHKRLCQKVVQTQKKLGNPETKMSEHKKNNAKLCEHKKKTLRKNAISNTQLGESPHKGNSRQFFFEPKWFLTPNPVHSSASSTKPIARSMFCKGKQKNHLKLFFKQIHHHRALQRSPAGLQASKRQKRLALACQTHAVNTNPEQILVKLLVIYQPNQ